MSGGSYDYAYSKLYELDRWVQTLEEMAESCKSHASSDSSDIRSLDDRASILVRSLLLEQAAKRLKDAIDNVHSLEKVMHDVEWVDSGDYGVNALVGPLK
jgi:hypothetical protein